MRKVLTYTSLLILVCGIVLVFVTAETYAQLSIGIVLYLPVAYYALQVFPRSGGKSRILPVEISPQPQKIVDIDKEKHADIADNEKRAFLKLIGLAGFSFFLYSVFRRRTGVPLFDKNQMVGTTGIEDTTGKKIHPAETHPTDGYKISEIDDNTIAYYGFTNKDGAWIIMREDTNTNSFRYTKGDAQFPDNWPKRDRLNYDYFHNVF